MCYCVVLLIPNIKPLHKGTFPVLSSLCKLLHVHYCFLLFHHVSIFMMCDSNYTSVFRGRRRGIWFTTISRPGQTTVCPATPRHSWGSSGVSASPTSPLTPPPCWSTAVQGWAGQGRSLCWTSCCRCWRPRL